MGGGYYPHLFFCGVLPPSTRGTNDMKGGGEICSYFGGGVIPPYFLFGRGVFTIDTPMLLCPCSIIGRNYVRNMKDRDKECEGPGLGT